MRNPRILLIAVKVGFAACDSFIVDRYSYTAFCIGATVASARIVSKLIESALLDIKAHIRQQFGALSFIEDLFVHTEIFVFVIS